jgi:hypothetical protein
MTYIYGWSENRVILTSYRIRQVMPKITTQTKKKLQNMQLADDFCSQISHHYRKLAY